MMAGSRSKKDSRQRIDPEVFSTLMQTEMVDILNKVNNNLQGISNNIGFQTPLGKFKDTVITVQTDEEILDFYNDFKRPATSVSIRNDGPGSLYVGLNAKTKSTGAPVPANDKVDFSFNGAVIRYITLRGSAQTSVRVYTTW
jgi:hypothetical protein